MIAIFAIFGRSFIAGAVALLTINVSTAGAASHEIVVEPPQPVEAWYQALGSVDRRAFEGLIADGTKIILKDLGIEQSKQEFIDALDEWERSTGGATIVYRYEDIGDDSAKVLVCYRFKSNETLTSETFTFNDTQIIGSVQEASSDSCERF